MVYYLTHSITFFHNRRNVRFIKTFSSMDMALDRNHLPLSPVLICFRSSITSTHSNWLIFLVVEQPSHQDACGVCDAVDGWVLCWCSRPCIRRLCNAKVCLSPISFNSSVPRLILTLQCLIVC